MIHNVKNNLIIFRFNDIFTDMLISIFFHFKTMEAKKFCIIGIIIIIILSVYYVYLKKESFKKHEKFIYMSEDAKITPAGAIHADRIMTDQQLYGTDAENIRDHVKSQGAYNEPQWTGSFGPGMNDAKFNTLLENQAEVNAANRSHRNDELRTREELNALSKKINHAGDSSKYNIVNRAKQTPTKLKLSRGQKRGVIDAKYIPTRYRPKTVELVDTVIPIQGYDISEEKLDQQIYDESNKLSLGQMNVDNDVEPDDAFEIAKQFDIQTEDLENNIQNLEKFKTSRGMMIGGNDARYSL